MQRVLILGAGGHAQVIANILLRMNETFGSCCPIGYLDDNRELHGQTLLGLPVLGGMPDLPQIAYDALIVAIGDNYSRWKLFNRLQQQGVCFVIAMHPAAVIAPDVEIGKGTVIGAGVVVNPGSKIGNNVILNTACTVDHHNQIDDHVHIAPGVHSGGNVTIGEGTLIGIGATIMPHCRVGAWSTVGAGALVHADVPDHVVVVGVPAHIVRHAEAEVRSFGE